MDSNLVYKIVLYAAAKNKEQGYISPEDFNTVLMPMAQNSYLDYLLGEYEKYQLQHPISVVEFGQNQRIRQSISPLIYGIVLNVNAQGISSFPNDYAYNDAMWTQYGYYNIKFIQQDRQDSYLHSTIDPIASTPKVTNPVYLINHEGFHFFPEDIGFAKMSYVRVPPPIVWGYDLDSNGRPVYNPAKSQQPVWQDSDLYEIIVRALALVGVNLQVGLILQYANDIKNGGQ